MIHTTKIDFCKIIVVDKCSFGPLRSFGAKRAGPGESYCSLGPKGRGQITNSYAINNCNELDRHLFCSNERPARRAERPPHLRSGGLAPPLWGGASAERLSAPRLSPPRAVGGLFGVPLRGVNTISISAPVIKSKCVKGCCNSLNQSISGKTLISSRPIAKLPHLS
jgi:hypothetical protein